VSDLDDHLLAQGGECEHLAKLFAYKRGMDESGFPCLPLSTTPWTDALTQLLARIAELEAENKKAVYGCCEECGVIADLEKSEAERDALKCCGNCVHYTQDPDFVGECDASGAVDPARQAFADGRYLASHYCCIFAPSCWQPREGGKG